MSPSRSDPLLFPFLKGEDVTLKYHEKSPQGPSPLSEPVLELVKIRFGVKEVEVLSRLKSVKGESYEPSS